MLNQKNLGLILFTYLILYPCRVVDAFSQETSVNDNHLSERNLLASSSNLCFKKQPTNAFPQILGGSTGLTQFECLSYDSTAGQILLGGYTESTDIISYSKAAMLTLINEATGKTVWHRQFASSLISPTISDLSPEQFTSCSIQDGATKTYIVVQSQTPQYGIHLFLKSDGSHVKSYKEYNTGTLSYQKNRSAIGVFMSSANKIYLISTESNRVLVSAFTFDSTVTVITPIYYKSHGSASKPLVGFQMTIKSDRSAFYISGSCNQEPAFMKVKLSDGTTPFIYTVSNPNGSSAQQKLSLIALYEVSGLEYFVGCAENLGPSQDDIAFLYYTNLIGVIPSLVKAWYHTTSGATTCLNLKIDATKIYFLINSPDTVAYYGSLTISSSTSAALTPIRLSSSTNTLFTRAAYIKSSSPEIYYIGSTTNINGNSYTQKSAFLNKYPTSGSGCLTGSYSTTTVSYNTITIFLLNNYISAATSFSVTPTDEIIQYQVESNVASTSMIDINLVTLPTNCLSYLNVGTIIEPPLAQQTYTLSDPALTISIPEFTYSITDCSDSYIWVYSAYFSNGTSLPTGITFTQLTTGLGSKIVVNTADTTYINTHTIQITAVLNGLYTKSSSFFLQINNTVSSGGSGGGSSSGGSSGSTVTNSAPYFFNKLQEYFKMYSNEELRFAFPRILDTQQDQVSLKITEMGKPDSAKLNYISSYTENYVLLSPSSSDIGLHRLVITLTDNFAGDNMSSQYMIILEVLKTVSPTPKPNITITNPQQNQTTSESFKLDNDFTISIHVIKPNQIKVTFSKQLDLSPEEFKRLVKSIFQFKTANENSEDDQILSWTVGSYNKMGFTMNMDYVDESIISKMQDPDYLYGQVNKDFYMNGKQNQLEQSVRIPYYDDDENSEAQLATSETAAMAVQSIIYGSVAMSIVLGSSLQMLWGMLNTLQLISHTPLFKIAYSTIILRFIKAMFSVVNFDMFDASAQLQVIFGLDDIEVYPAYNTYFEYLGYDNSNFLYLIGPPIITVFIYLGILLIYLIILKIDQRQQEYLIFNSSFYFSVNIVKKKLFKFLFLSTLVRFFMELALEIALSTIVNIKMKKADTSGEIFSYSISFICMIAIGISSIFLPFLIHKMQYKDHRKLMKKYLDDVIEDVKYLRITGWLYHSIFIARRFIFALFVFQLEEYVAIQVQIFIFFNLLYIIYLIAGKPTRKERYQEIFNEMCTLTLSYFMFIYCDYVKSSDVKYICGYIFVGIFLFNILVNLTVIFIKGVKDAIKAIKKLRFKCKVRNRLRQQFKYKIQEQQKGFIMKSLQNQFVTPVKPKQKLSQNSNKSLMSNIFSKVSSLDLPSEPQIPKNFLSLEEIEEVEEQTTRGKASGREDLNIDVTHYRNNTGRKKIRSKKHPSSKIQSSQVLGFQKKQTQALNQIENPSKFRPKLKLSSMSKIQSQKIDTQLSNIHKKQSNDDDFQSVLDSFIDGKKSIISPSIKQSDSSIAKSTKTAKKSKFKGPSKKQRLKLKLHKYQSQNENIIIEEPNEFSLPKMQLNNKKQSVNYTIEIHDLDNSSSLPLEVSQINYPMKVSQFMIQHKKTPSLKLSQSLMNSYRNNAEISQRSEIDYDTQQSQPNISRSKSNNNQNDQIQYPFEQVNNYISDSQNLQRNDSDFIPGNKLKLPQKNLSGNSYKNSGYVPPLIYGDIIIGNSQQEPSPMSQTLSDINFLTNRHPFLQKNNPGKSQFLRNREYKSSNQLGEDPQKQKSNFLDSFDN
eukprot:403366702